MHLCSSQSSCESTQRGCLPTETVVLRLVEMLFTECELRLLCVSFAPLRDVHNPGLLPAQHARRTSGVEGFVFCTCS